LSEILGDQGYEVETADNATDALEKLENKRYSLILLDIKMHGMSGIELYKHLQKKAKSLSKRVVFITGDIMGKDTWQFLRRTKAPYLTKPFDEEKLEKEINRILTQCE
jgi:CheY-like chemotaxis protein